MTPTREPRFGRYERELVLRVSRHLLKNDDDAEDAAQDAMVKAFRNRASFRGDAEFTTWLYRVAATTALMHLRKRRVVETRTLGLDAGERLRAPGPDPEERTVATIEVARARRRLEKMNATSRAILGGVAEGYTSAELGERLGLKVATVKTRVMRGRAALRAA